MPSFDATTVAESLGRVRERIASAGGDEHVTDVDRHLGATGAAGALHLDGASDLDGARVDDDPGLTGHVLRVGGRGEQHHEQTTEHEHSSDQRDSSAV